MVDNNDAFAPVGNPSAPLQEPQDAFAPIQNPVVSPTPQATDQNAPGGAPGASNAESVNLINPEGKLVSVPQGQLTQALDTGYRQPSAQEIHKATLDAKYGDQKLITGLEGAAQGATFGLSAGLERLAGVNPEDIAGRREANPNSHAIGQVGGLLGSALIPVAGEANILAHAGQAVGTALGIHAAEGLVAKIGSAIVKGAVENAIFQSGDEVGKMLISDPQQSAQTALTNVGLAAALGGGISGAIGGVSPLIDAASGTKVGKLLGALKNKVGGIEGETATEVSQALETTGIQVPAEVRAALDSNPEARGMFQHLMESSTSSGEKAQKSFQRFKSEASDTMIKALGKDPETIGASLTHASDYEAGEALKKELADRLKQSTDPISEQFTKIKEKYKGVELGQATKGEIEQNILQAAESEGWNLSPSSPQARTVARVMDELPGLKTLDDLRKYTSVIGDNTNAPELWRLGSQLKKILRTAEETALDTHLGAEAPELLTEHAAARGAYRSQMETIDALNDRLHVGRYSGPGSFIKNLKEMAPEDVLRRLSPKNDAGIIGELSTKFAGAAELLKQYHLDQLIKGASMAVKGEGESVSSKALLKGIEKMSPEMQAFVLPKGAKVQIEAVKTLLDAVPAKLNTSGTAKALDSLWGHAGSSAMGVVAALTGHNAAAAALIGGLGKVIGRDVPDAIKLSLLKFLGSSQHIDSAGFNSMVSYIDQAIKGENLIGSATKNVFKAGREVLPQAFQSKETDRKKLDRTIQSIQADPMQLMENGSQVGHYLADHASAIGATAANVTNYVASKRPAPLQLSPLDRPMQPSAEEKAQYNRLLDIAQQPLTVLQHVKNGTLQASDVVNLKAMYPALYDKLSKQLVEQMSESVRKEETIPYATKLGMSLFLGQALDSSMTPTGIQAAQPQGPAATTPQAPQAGGVVKPSASGTKNLTKMPGMYQTPDQSRTQRGQRDH